MPSDAMLRLAVAQAAYKALGAAVSTRDPSSLRGQVDDECRRLYEDMGVVPRIPVHDGAGNQVALLSGRLTKPSRTERLAVLDADALMGEDRDLREDFLRAHANLFAEWLYEEHGVIPEGCDVVVEEQPGGEWAGTTLTGCDPAVTLPALVGELPAPLSALLLPDGGDA